MPTPCTPGAQPLTRPASQACSPRRPLGVQPPKARASLRPWSPWGPSGLPPVALWSRAGRWTTSALSARRPGGTSVTRPYGTDGRQRAGARHAAPPPGPAPRADTPSAGGSQGRAPPSPSHGAPQSSGGGRRPPGPRPPPSPGAGGAQARQAPGPRLPRGTAPPGSARAPSGLRASPGHGLRGARPRACWPAATRGIRGALRHGSSCASPRPRGTKAAPSTRAARRPRGALAPPWRRLPPRTTRSHAAGRGAQPRDRGRQRARRWRRGDTRSVRAAGMTLRDG
jgi:translation initiation factor IF-2